MPANVQGTFATGSNPVSGNTSDVLEVPTGVTSAKLTTTGLDASNTIKTQKRTAGGTWADQTTYNSDQTNTAVTVAAGEEWQIVGVTQQAFKDLRFKFTAES
jgi:hypothetical protein